MMEVVALYYAEETDEAAPTSAQILEVSKKGFSNMDANDDKLISRGEWLNFVQESS